MIERESGPVPVVNTLQSTGRIIPVVVVGRRVLHTTGAPVHFGVFSRSEIFPWERCIVYPMVLFDLIILPKWGIPEKSIKNAAQRR